MSLWTAQEAATATKGEAHGDWAASGVSIDTRTIARGDLFVALKAARDGHEFVAAALERGAAAAVVTHIPDGVARDSPLLIVKDVQSALEALGEAGRARSTARVVAITGSVGKTSTKEMLRAMLEPQGKTHASVASYNNHWGVPLTLARMPKDTEFAVIEIGMNHPGEIAPLARMARPHVAMITTVAAAHLEAFESIEGIAEEKASILEGLEPGGTAIINTDIDQADILRRVAGTYADQVMDFGHTATELHLSDVSLHNDVTVAQATIHGVELVFKIGTPGRHFALNGLAALGAAEALGADLALSCQGLGRWSPYEGRGVRERVMLDPVETSEFLDLIDDSYNANPTSMAAALEVLAAADVQDGKGRIAKGRRVAFLGDMKELGPDGPALHAALAKLPFMKNLEQVHCVGPLMKSLYDALPEPQRGVWVETSAELLDEGLRRYLDSGDVVLAKGSLSMQLGRIVDAIRKMGHADATADTLDDE